MRLDEGDVILVRSGWSRHWNDPVRFLGHVEGAPGPGVEAARWLAEHRPIAVGAETIIAAVKTAGKQGDWAVVGIHVRVLLECGLRVV